VDELGLVVVSLNVQCLRTKYNILQIYINELKPDVLCLSEHWMVKDQLTVYQDISYLSVVSSYCRTKALRGGSDVYVRD